tara:strand:- start:40 stop:702 length:663 start_codon:yes stop_codon:yes gene_type:complete
MAAKIPANGADLNGLIISGTTPTITIGDAGAEDAKIVFDGNAQDFHIGMDDSVDDLIIGKGSALGTTSNIVIDENGHVTMPLQPAFLVNSSGVTNFATGQWNTLTFDTEREDKNGDFASNTFTAPVTGMYLLTAWIYYQNMDSAAASVETWFYASNRTEGIMVNSPGQDLSADAAYQGYSGSIVMDMDANDTVYIRMYQDAGAAQMDLNVTSAFAGCLLA